MNLANPQKREVMLALVATVVLIGLHFWVAKVNSAPQQIKKYVIADLVFREVRSASLVATPTASVLTVENHDSTIIWKVKRQVDPDTAFEKIEELIDRESEYASVYTHKDEVPDRPIRNKDLFVLTDWDTARDKVAFEAQLRSLLQGSLGD